MSKIINKHLFSITPNYYRYFLKYSNSRCFSSSNIYKCSEESKKSNSKGGIYKIFQDEESPIILDVEEEKASMNAATRTKTQINEQWDEFYGINLSRGKTGVYEIEDLVDVIRKNRGQNVFVVKVPAILNYVDYLVVVTCTSNRHIFALSQFVLKVFKKKRYDSDHVPRVIGEKTSHWVALDLGNIALHIMTELEREKYDLETLWSVGAKFDDMSLKSDDSTLEILQKHSISLDSFKPVNNQIS